MTRRRRADRLLLDEMFSGRIAVLVSERGVDCRAVCVDPVLTSSADEAILDGALADARVLVTNNVADFERLRRARLADDEAVPGLIYTSDVAFPRNREFVARLAEALVHAAESGLTSAGGGVHWLQPMDP